MIHINKHNSLQMIAHCFYYKDINPLFNKSQDQCTQSRLSWDQKLERCTLQLKVAEIAFQLDFSSEDLSHVLMQPSLEVWHWVRGLEWRTFSENFLLTGIRKFKMLTIIKMSLSLYLGVDGIIQRLNSIKLLYVCYVKELYSGMVCTHIFLLKK